MNLKSLLEDLRTLAAIPGRGQVQMDRIRATINIALKKLWADMPDALLREEYRFRLEPPISVSTIGVDGTDRKVFTVTAAATVPPQLSIDGTLRGRTLEIERDGRYYYRRIRDVFVQELQEPNPDKLHIVVDRPWDNNTDTELTYRIITRDYPYPSDVKEIQAVFYDPESSPSQVLEPMLKGELDRYRYSMGWRESGTISKFSRGDFYQEPAPHEKPGVSVQSIESQQNADKWGYDESGVEHDSAVVPHYGNAGTFQYCYVLVWGRWPWSQLSVGDRGDGFSNSNQGALSPFYMSSPSQVSDQVTTTWGGGYIRVSSLDVDYQWGYGPDSTLLSYHHWGAEKWWFRRRVASEEAGGTNNAVFQEDADGVWYLWKITPGYQTLVTDRGDMDPVDKRFRLEDVHGHQHIRFDVLPAAGEDKEILCMVLRRPPKLAHDQDYVRVPPECEMALVNLAHSYLLGRREGEPNTESHYWGAYQGELDRLIDEYATEGFNHGPFGDGLSGTPWSGHRLMGDVGEIS